MPTTDTIQVQLVWTLDGVDWAVNNLHYVWAGGSSVTQAVADDIATAVSSHFSSSGLQGNYSTTVALDRVRVRDLRVAGAPFWESSVGDAGTGTGGMLPRQTAEVVTVHSTLATRRGRGRVYFPAMEIGSTTTQGTIASGTVTELLAFMNAVETLPSAGGPTMGLGVLSRVDNITRAAVSYSVDTTFDVQTRRRDVAI